MHYTMLNDNGSKNTTHWNIFWTLTHVTIVITVIVVIAVPVTVAAAATGWYQCRFQTLPNALQSGNVHVFCICVSVSV